MPKSSIDGVTLNTKGTVVKVAMVNLTVQEQDDLALLLKYIGRVEASIRQQTLRSLLEHFHVGSKSVKPST